MWGYKVTGNFLEFLSISASISKLHSLLQKNPFFSFTLLSEDLTNRAFFFHQPIIKSVKTIVVFLTYMGSTNWDIFGHLQNYSYLFFYSILESLPFLTIRFENIWELCTLHSWDISLCRSKYLFRKFYLVLYL